MLSSEQFEAVGRLAIAFNELDELLAIWLLSFLEIREIRVAEIAVFEEPFSGKADFLRKVLRAWADTYNASEEQVEKVKCLIGEASELSKKRNQLIHSTRSFVRDHRGFFTSKSGFYHRGKLIAVEPEKILQTVAQIENLHKKLNDACYELADRLRICTGRHLIIPARLQLEDD